MKEGTEKAVQILHPIAGGQDPAKNAWLMHSHFKHIRNKGHIETECFGRKYNSVETEQKLDLRCATGSRELFGAQEAVLDPLPSVEGISS